MPVKLNFEKDKLYALLCGEIDHHNAAGIREKIDESIRENQPVELILDFSQVTFMDSSGIGLVMGRFKAMNEIGGKVVVCGTSQPIEKVMKLSGLDRLATIRK